MAGLMAMAATTGTAACRGDERSRPARVDSASTGGGAVTPGILVRATFTADSATAAALADSLDREGWDASSPRRPSEDGRWPVNVLLAGDSAVGSLTAKAFADAGLEPAVIGSRPGQRGLAVAITRVNRGTHGMSARVRWALSADRRALLVVEDPRSIENEPLPNGFVFAVEGAPLVQRDSVWDVMPSPDWRRLAYGRAYTTTPGESDSIPPREWHRLAGQVGLIESTVRKNVFPTSGMVTAFGVARPFVVDARAVVDTIPFPVVALPIAEGWRVGWTRDGSGLAIGAPPEVMADDAPASRWHLVDLATGEDRGPTDATSLASLKWTEGPMLDISTAVDMKQRRAFRSGTLDVESEEGWIRVYVHDGGRIRAPRVIGPGIALTATTNGEFVVAIAADPAAQSYNPPNQVVVYHIRRP
jgi:hypothetical protein